MLHLPGCVRVTWFCSETFHPSVADAVEEDDKTFDKLSRWDVLPASDGDPVPRPAEFREGTQKAGESDKSIAPEDSTLDEMCKADVDVICSASTGVYNDTGKQFYKPGKDEESFQRGKNRGTELAVPGFFAVQLRGDIVQGVIGTNGMVTSVKSRGNSCAV